VKRKLTAEGASRYEERIRRWWWILVSEAEMRSGSSRRTGSYGFVVEEKR